MEKEINHKTKPKSFAVGGTVSVGQGFEPRNRSDTGLKFRVKLYLSVQKSSTTSYIMIPFDDVFNIQLKKVFLAIVL